MDRQKRENARLAKIEIDRLRKQIWDEGSDLKKQKMMEAEAEARRLKRFAEQDAEIYKEQLKQKIDEEIDALRTKAKEIANREYDREMQKLLKSQDHEFHQNQLKKAQANFKRFELQEQQYEKEQERQAQIAEKQRQAELEKERKKQLEIQKRMEYEAQLRENERKLQRQCEEIFNTRPIPFVPRPGVKLDEKIAEIIKDKNIKAPVEWIKGNSYLIGSQKQVCDLKVENVVVRSGGGYERFDSMVPKNDLYYQQTLINHMLSTKQSLPQVVEQLK